MFLAYWHIIKKFELSGYKSEKKEKLKKVLIMKEIKVRELGLHANIQRWNMKEMRN